MARWIARVAMAALTLGVLLGASGQPAQAQTVGLRFPAPAGTAWQIIAGYNTATHVDIDPYAIDIVRTDGKTEGTPVLSPVTGRVGYIGQDCFSVRTDDVNILLCHVVADEDLERGQRVGAGQRLGVVAQPGEAGNNGYPHIHIGLEGFDPDDDDRRGGSTGDRTPLPFTGDYRMEGASLTRSSASNAHYGTRFVSTNDPSLSRVEVDAGADQTVEPGQGVSLTANGADIDAFTWEQVEGTPVTVEAFGEGSIAFLAPVEPGAVLWFRLTGASDLGTDTDLVKVTVRGAPVVPVETRARILAGDVPSRGIGLIVFGGGTNEELVAAAACRVEDVAFFAADAGTLVGFIPAAQVGLVNQRWDALYPDGMPANLALIVRCG